jgi:hypothetical protein
LAVLHRPPPSSCHLAESDRALLSAVERFSKSRGPMVSTQRPVPGPFSPLIDSHWARGRQYRMYIVLSFVRISGCQFLIDNGYAANECIVQQHRQTDAVLYCTASFPRQVMDNCHQSKAHRGASSHGARTWTIWAAILANTRPHSEAHLNSN